jgi:microcystin-dependent protein
MPRNGSGTFSVTNTYSSGQTITAAIINANFSDVGSEITNSVAKDGQTTMTGQLKASAGTAAAPSITFGGDTDTGLYRKSADTIGISVGGAEVAEISAKGSTLVPTGVMMPYVATTAPTGWVRANGRTIGSASSGASERANADAATLYALLWGSYSDSVCAVSSGRGASAAADFAANKTIGLPDLRGRGLFGLDDMGNSAASRLGSVVTGTTNGASGGAETVTLVEANLPSHTHAAGTLATVSEGDHNHTYTLTTTGGGINGIASLGNGQQTANTSTTGTHTHAIFGSTASVGSDTAVSNMPPAFLTTYIIKL